MKIKLCGFYFLKKPVKLSSTTSLSIGHGRCSCLFCTLSESELSWAVFFTLRNVALYINNAIYCVLRHRKVKNIVEQPKEKKRGISLLFFITKFYPTNIFFNILIVQLKCPFYMITLRYRYINTHTYQLEAT